MKILQVNKFLHPNGGSETYMFQLTNALQELGHEVKIWGMEDQRNISADFPEFEASNIDYKNQSFSKKLSSTFGTIYSYENRKKISKVLEIFKPDIVHIHNYNFQLTPSILPEIKKRGIKIVQTVHDGQMVCPYHRLFNFQRNETCIKCVKGSFFNCIKDKCFDGSIFKSVVGASESMFYHQLNFYNKYIDVFISPSYFLAGLLSNKINKEIKVIPNFTEIKTSSMINDQPGGYYLFYGRITEEKGIVELIDIFKETQLNLIIIGTGNLVELIEEKIKPFNNIKYLGPKYNEELFDYVKNAKYVIIPSKWFENCPMTIIESFALNVPVIGDNHSGFKDLITNEKTGYLIDFKERTTIVSKLIEIDKKDPSSLKENIRDYFQKNLTKEIHIQRVLEVYKF